MKRYRLFTNDRNTSKGVPLYSALREVRAASAEEAREKCPPQFDAPHVAPAKAIEWPPATAADKQWVLKHVDARSLNL